MEQPSYQTTKNNIIETAIDLTDNKKFKELQPTNNYLICDALIIDNSKKTFWFTTSTTMDHTKKLIEFKNQTLTQYGN